jgi:hypothetical protein
MLNHLHCGFVPDFGVLVDENPAKLSGGFVPEFVTVDNATVNRIWGGFVKRSDFQPKINFVLLL